MTTSSIVDTLLQEASDLYDKGKYREAIVYYEKSLAINLETLGVEHPEVGTSYNNIGLA